MIKKTVVTLVLAIVLIVSACIPAFAAQKDEKDGTVVILPYIGIDKSNLKQPKIFGYVEATSTHPDLKHLNLHGVLTTKAGTAKENYTTIATQQQVGTSYSESSPATCKVVADFVIGQDYVFTTKTRTYYKKGGNSALTFGEEQYKHTSTYQQQSITDRLEKTIDERNETMEKYDQEIDKLTSQLNDINKYCLPAYENRSNK